MKIVRIIARLNVGGPARHVVWLDRALQDGEFSSVLLTGRVPEGEEDMAYFAESHGVRPVYIEQMSRELSPQDLVSLWKIYRRIVRERPDIIHTHTAKAGTVGRLSGLLYRWLTWRTLIGRPRRVKIVHTFHGHIFHGYYGPLKTKLFLLIERLLARLATDRIVVISRQQKEEIHETYGIGRPAQFEIIPLGIDLGVFKDGGADKENALRGETGVREDELLTGLVGRLTEIKNHQMFLDAAALCRDERERDPTLPRLRFVVIGDGHLRPELEAQAAASGLEDSLVFAGNRTDAEVFYRGLDIVALTSRNEGTPLSLIEAMACGRPVIATAVGGVVDLLGEVVSAEDGYEICRRGIRTRPDDVEAFRRGLRRLAGDPELRTELGRAGREYVLANYDVGRLVGDIRRLYRELAAS